MKSVKEAMLLYAVTDRAWTGEKTLFGQVEEALLGGVTCVQLREKELDDDTFLTEAIEMKELCHRYSIPFIVNDNVEVAIKSGADGIHVGQEDCSAAEVRARIGAKMILGVSAQTVEQALLAEQSGADYLGVGAVFPTASKQDADEVSRETLTAICHAVNIPVVAIGGISRDNLHQLSGTGIDGVSLISAIFAKSDITDECKILLALSKKMVKGKSE